MVTIIRKNGFKGFDKLKTIKIAHVTVKNYSRNDIFGRDYFWFVFNWFWGTDKCEMFVHCFCIFVNKNAYLLLSSVHVHKPSCEESFSYFNSKKFLYV